jgi:hypothetical protein
MWSWVLVHSDLDGAIAGADDITVYDHLEGLALRSSQLEAYAGSRRKALTRNGNDEA